MLFFLKQMFSFVVTDYKIYISFFGIKINYKRKASKNTIEKYKNYSAFDLPKATGSVRKIQLALLKILKIFDAFCEENGLEYWLEHGTLLGAFRNKGFITWDDDVDLGMMRDDYEKFIKLIKEDGKRLGNDLEIVFETNGRHICLLKIIHKKLDCVQIDIFPYDYFYKKTTAEDKYNLTLRLFQQANKNNYPISDIINIFNPKKVMSKFKKITMEKFLKGNIVDKKIKPSVFCGIDFPYFTRKCLVYDYEDFFPLQKIRFEDYDFSCPHDTKKMLEYMFEDYTKLPENCYPHHYGSEKLPKKVEKQLDLFLSEE